MTRKISIIAFAMSVLVGIYFVLLLTMPAGSFIYSIPLLYAAVFIAVLSAVFAIAGIRVRRSVLTISTVVLSSIIAIVIVLFFMFALIMGAE